MASLVIDARERSITQYADVLAGISYKIDQITIGDYVVSAGDKILAVIERKSLSDFASSLRDGRIDNRAKMYELRERTGCAVVFIIEGPEFPAPDFLVGKTPYKAIESCIFHMIVRDRVSILRSPNMLGTAKLLARFMQSMTTMLAEMPGGYEPTPAPVELKACDIDAEINRKITRSDEEIVAAMWACIPRVSVDRAPVYMRRWAISQLVCAQVPLDEIKSTKLASGRPLGPKLWQTLFGIPAAEDVHIKMLAAVPGISRKTAVELLKGRDLRAVLGLDSAAIAELQSGASARKLGPKKAAAILHYFNYKPT